MDPVAAPRIYFVDDDDELRLLVCEELREHGFEVEEMASAAEARKCLQEVAQGLRPRPGVVFIDYFLTDGNGIELVDWMKGQAQPIAALPTVLLSADHDVARFAVPGRADAFVAKPPSIDDLTAQANQLAAQ